MESGWWKLKGDKAQELVGSEIYFHKKRLEPSFYGGTIVGYRVEQEGLHQGALCSNSNTVTHPEMSGRINMDGPEK